MVSTVLIISGFGMEGTAMRCTQRGGGGWISNFSPDHSYGEYVALIKKIFFCCVCVYTPPNVWVSVYVYIQLR